MAGLLGNGASSTSTGGGLLFAAKEKREKERVDAFQRSLHTSSQQAIDAVRANAPELIPYTPAQVETEPVKEKKGALKWLGDNLMSGLGQGNKAFYGVLQSIGGDKMPGVSKALDTAVKVSERDISKGGEDIGSKLVQAVPNAVTSLGMAAMTGGASLVPQLGKSAFQQAIQTMLRNPMFYNSLIRSYGGAYNEAREAGQDRGTAITAGLLTGIPEAVIEQAGGIEQVFKRPAKGLLPAIGRTALEEAAEGIAQYPFGGAVKKALYAPETPVYSTTEEAIINPVEMGKGALIEGIMGGLMGGVGKVMTGDVRIKPVQQTDIEYQAETPRSPAIYGEPIPHNINNPMTEKPVLYADPYGNITKDIEQSPKLLPAAEDTKANTPEALTQEEINILESPTTEVTRPKGYPDISILETNHLDALIKELQGDKGKMISDQVEWMKATSGKGVEPGGLIRNEFGDVMGRFGRISNNEQWYRE